MMTQTVLSSVQRAHAERNLPRYTSYPTAVAFDAAQVTQAPDWFAKTRSEDHLSVYVHVPFCRRLCWYCGCHTSIAHTYERVGTYADVLAREIDLTARRLGEHDGLAHLHFGGGSPNALSPSDFKRLVAQLKTAFRVRPGAEIAAELDPGMLSDTFVDATGEAGVTRVSLGVQTFDPTVQALVNRVQPFEQVAAAVERLRAVGVGGLNFDLMYGLPGQTVENVYASAKTAVALRPDRIAVFGYAHVPWMKKHQTMIQETDLADIDGRWAQADAADAALTEAGYVRIGLDHYALPDDSLSRAAAEGRLRRNFQGYTDDPAPVLVPIGPSSIGQFREGFVQNLTPTDAWAARIARDELPLGRALAFSDEDRLRAAVIERLMCDMTVDVAAICEAHGFSTDHLAGSLASLAAIEVAGLCVLDGAVVTIPEDARRLMRVVAAAFDDRLPATVTRHAKAV
ncbi:oxygen-independent coproporphyrinogen III oxidase [Caulobacter vibrioides]|uniref:Coproporphyrinogen-III oxidase n=2 Tax=Caulobacter vibrioides TaxID=155892 RepID=Q9A8E3_CAUVC|nr:oxygen-independent coproporphyrinogen III oxidase [Caulobacter vibrioides]YP_002516850.1 oxygen-independent coproporphyrinogen-III oxidase hemN [Caulobacter vibrioides NA1000]AAK23392.1 oxygen-independent coproporphyrinogen III oxidase [Caulobacter vibrioides CB15]ACL94942.1 oxygen-independent coproporphyrinogen-III oxidase hemN [Caulobacter vibrioides NA1000]ATC28220.1 oxygen-independent coproporphyrinogen III oxidase [Caulobacter vibrioides]QXZ53486.1 oxygen-independent coproporphyrinogen